MRFGLAVLFVLSMCGCIMDDPTAGPATNASLGDTCAGVPRHAAASCEVAVGSNGKPLLAVRDLRISAAQPANAASASVFASPTIDVVIDGFELRGHRAGVYIQPGQCLTCNVTLRNGILVGPEVDAGGSMTPFAGVFLSPMSGAYQGTITLENVTIAGFGDGVVFLGGILGGEAKSGHLVVRDVDVACGDHGIQALAAVDVKVEGLSATGCSHAGAWIAADSATLSDVQVSKSATGLLLDAAVTAHDIEATDNREVGVDIRSGDVTMTSCKLVGNGNGVSANAFGPTIIIHDCSIADNGTYGVTAVSNDGQVDVTGNWWGSPLGPAVHPAARVAGFGNAVFPTASFYPFLTTPP